MIDYTDATGHYQLPSIPQGIQNIKVEAEGYEPYNQSFYMYSSDKQIEITLRKYYNEEIYIDRDTYVIASACNIIMDGDEKTLWVINNGIKHSVILFHAPIDIPQSSEITKLLLKIVDRDEEWQADETYSGNWYIKVLLGEWNESNLNCDNIPEGLSFKIAYYISIKSITQITLNLRDVIEYSDSLFKYGFLIYPIYDNEYDPYGLGMHIYSKEYSNQNLRPKIILEYTLKFTTILISPAPALPLFLFPSYFFYSS